MFKILHIFLETLLRKCNTKSFMAYVYQKKKLHKVCNINRNNVGA